MAEDPGAIREAIEGTREDLAETIEALGQKADVKGRATAKVSESADEVKAKAADLGRRAEEALPEQAKPAFNAVSQKAQEASSSASGVAKRSPATILIVTGALVVLVLVRRRRKAGP